MQRKRDSEVNQQLAKVEATPTPTLLQQQAEKGNDKTQLQTEVAQLCRQLEETRAKIKVREQGTTAMQRPFNGFLGQIQAGPSKTVQMTEDEHKKLVARNAELLELLEVERTERESTLCHLQKALAETQRDMAICEEMLEARTRNCDMMDDERQRLQEQVSWLEARLSESKDENALLRRSLQSQRASLLYKDGEVNTSRQQSQEAQTETPNIEETETVLRLVESVQQLQVENARLEDALKRQSGPTAELHKAEEALLMRVGLEKPLAQKAWLEQTEEEVALLRGRLEEAQNRVEDKEREVLDVQKCFGNAFSKMRAEAVKMATSNTQLQELLEIERAERDRERSEREQERSKRERERFKIESYMLQLKQELDEARQEVLLYKVTSQEGSSERNSKFEEEKRDIQSYVWRLEGTLKESEAKRVQSEHKINKLISSLREKDCEVITSAQRLQEVFAASESTDLTVQLLRESVQQLESDTLRLEEASNEQARRVTELEKEIDEAARVKRDLEERLRWEMKRRSSLSLNGRVESREMEVALQDERKKFSETQELQKGLQAQLKQAEKERLTLQQQLDDSQQRTELKDLALKDMQDFLTDTLQQCSEENVQSVEDRGTSVVAPGKAESQELIERTDMGQDSILRQLRKELDNMQMKLSLCEESLEDKMLCCKDLALKNQGMQEDIGRLQRILQESEDKLIQSECSIFQLKRALEEDKAVIAFPQKPKEGASVSTDTAETAESLRQLEGEKARLEETSRQQASRISELEKEVNEAVRVKRDVEERLGNEIQSSFPVNAPVEVSDTEVTLQNREQKFRKAKQPKENLHEQLESVKIDRLILRQRLREAKKISELRDLAVMDMQRCMKDTLEGMQVYSQDKIELAERRSKVFASDIAELQEQLEGGKTDGTLSQLQKGLAEMRQKLSLCEELLEGKTFQCRDLEEEKQLLQKDLNTLKEVLQQTKDKYVQLEHYKFNLKCALEDQEPEAVAFSQKLQESVSTSTDTDQTMQVGSLQLLESENYRLEKALKEQAGRIAELEQEVDEARRVKRDLEEQLSQEVERQSLLSINAPVQVRDTEAAVQDEGEKFSKTQKLQEKEQVQSEGLLLQQQLEEAQEVAALKDQASSDVQSCINETFEYSQKIQLLESRSKVFASKITELECVKPERDSTLSQLQKELAEIRQKLSLREESLEGKTLRCGDLEEEKRLLQEDLNKLREVLQQTEEKYVQLERYNFNLKCALEDKECEDTTAFAQLLESKNVDSRGLLEDLQKEMVDMQDKLSFCEESLKVKTRCCREREEENLYVKEDMTTLRRILQEAEERHVQSEHCNFSLKCVLEDKEREVIALTQKLQEVTSAPTDLEETVTQADGSVQGSGSEGTYRDSPPRLPSKPADVQTKLSLCEELLEEASRRYRDLEEEKLGLQQDMNALRRMLQEGEENYVQLERRNFELKCALNDQGGEVISQGLQEVLDTEEAPVTKEGFEEQALREALQERVEYEAVPLHRHLEDVEEEVEEQISDVQNPFSSTVANTLADYSRRVQPVEELGNQPAGVDTDLQLLLEHEISDRKRELSQLPRGLAGALELLEIKIQKCRNLKDQLDMLTKLLEASEHQNVRLELCVRNLRSALDSGEQKVVATSLKLHQALTALSAAEKTIARLEESVSCLKAENGELKARHQAGRVTAQRKTAGTAKMERSHPEKWINRRETKSRTQLEEELAYLKWTVPSQRFS